MLLRKQGRILVFSYITLNTLLTYFGDIKARNGIIIYDTHIHPFDVLGVCDKKPVNSIERAESEPSLLEKLNFNPLALSILDALFLGAPWYIKKNICTNFATDNYSKLIREMDNTNVDRGVIVPIAPFVGVDTLTPYMNSNRFSILGTIDIHNIGIDGIEKELLRQIKEYKIQGIKLHPNIQRFYPIPSHNEEELAEKLVRLYESVNKLKLYVLFHSGISYLPSGGGFEKVLYAVLENFFDKNKNLFDFLSVPIVLAHLGSYNIKVPNNDLLNKVFQQYDHVYLDTAGVNSSFIDKLINKTTSEKIIFGSDAGYFDIKHSVYRILRSLQNGSTGLHDELIIKIFSQNYLNLLENLK